MPDGLDPKSAAVRQKQPIARPAAMSGSQRCFCASDPNAQIGYITSELCTEQNERMPEWPRSSSWQISPYAVGEVPGQPAPGSDAPSRPSLPDSATSSRRKLPRAPG